MRKILFIALVMLGVSSCALHRSTSSTQKIISIEPLATPVVADLNVGEKITYTYQAERNLKMRLSRQELIEDAVACALQANGEADVLLQPQYKFYYVEGQKYYKIIVTGYPAKYVNFRNVTKTDLDLILNANALQSSISDRPVLIRQRKSK
jgi:hypothetical protein